jgi:hypothetical protein
MDILDNNDDLPDAECDMLLARLVGAFDVYEDSDATEDDIILAYCNLSDAIDSAIAAMGSGNASDEANTPDTDVDIVIPDRCPTLPEEPADDTMYVIYGEQPEDMDLTGVGLIIQDRCPTLPEERVPQIYGETPEDMDVTDVEHIDLIIPDRYPTLPEERVAQIYGETPEDMDVTDSEHIDLIVPDRCPTLPEERTPVIYGEQPEDMDLSNVDLIVPDRYRTADAEPDVVIYGEQTEDTDMTNVDLIVPDRCPTLSEEAPAAQDENQDEQTSDFEITTGESVTIEAQEEPEVTPEASEQTETPAAQTPATVTPAPSADTTNNDIPSNIIIDADQVEIVFVNGSSYEVSTPSEETAAPAATVASPAVSASASSAPAAAPAAAVVVETAATDRATLVERLVERFYESALNRKSDVAGKAYWIDLLMNQDADFNTVVNGFLNSTEFMDRNLNTEDFVTTLYKVFFNRMPSAAEKNYWMNKLADGMTRNELINAFTNSAEWEATCETAGIV